MEGLGIVVGIDFGTTYTGCAWAISTNPHDVHVINTWDTDNEFGTDTAKVPTRISYNQRREVASWGHKPQPDDVVTCSWFKLLLSDAAIQRSNEQTDMLKKLQAQLSQIGKQPVDVVADYLRELWAHIRSEIRSRVRQTVFKNAKIKFVLTTPAIWDHQAQQLTRDAAEKAGLLEEERFSLTMVSEPEAAACFVLNDSPGLQVGEILTICDAGGGTLDFVSYKIQNLDPFQLEMVSHPTGTVNGGIFLDMEFLTHMEFTIGMQKYAALTHRSKEKITNQWLQGIKHSFDEWMAKTPPKRFPIDIPRQSTEDEDFGSAYDHSVAISGTDIKGWYDPICTRVFSLLDEQIELVNRSISEKPAAIFLVGGFGGSKYLRKMIEKRFKTLEVVQPVNSWSAIARGAVLKGLAKEIVINHVARYHYGIVTREPFIKGVHKKRHKTWCEIKTMWMADDQMQWFLNKGQSILNSAPICHPFFRCILHQSDLENVRFGFQYCPLSNAPTTKTPDIMPLCSFSINFSDIVQFEDLPRQMNSKGRVWAKLSYIVIMKLSGGAIEWEIEFRGKTVKSHSVSVDWTS